MQTIVLALSTRRQSSKAIKQALDIANKESAKLIIIFVAEIPSSLALASVDIGIWGNEAVLKEYEKEGERILQAIQKHAKSLNIECGTLIAKGKFTKECLRVIKEKKADLVIVARTKGFDLSDIFFGSPITKIGRRANCFVKTV